MTSKTEEKNRKDVGRKRDGESTALRCFVLSQYSLSQPKTDSTCQVKNISIGKIHQQSILSGFQDGFSEGKLGGTIKIRVETQVQTDLTFQDIKAVHHSFHDFSTGRVRNHFLLWSKPREAHEIAEINRCSAPKKTWYVIAF
jgi:hypothetical protein